MEKCNKYLIELKELYLNFDRLKDAPFIFFSFYKISNIQLFSSPNPLRRKGLF